MSTQGPFKIVGFVKHHPSLSEEQFYNHWENIHAPLVSPWCIKHGVIEYRQIHTPSHLRSQWASVNGKDSFDFDGMGEMTFTSFERFITAFTDPYSKNVIQVDEDRFLDKTKSVLPTSTMGVAKKIIEGGEIRVEVGREVMKEWEEWEEKGKTASG